MSLKDCQFVFIFQTLALLALLSSRTWAVSVTAAWGGAPVQPQGGGEARHPCPRLTMCCSLLPTSPPHAPEFAQSSEGESEQNPARYHSYKLFLKKKRGKKKRQIGKSMQYFQASPLVNIHHNKVLIHSFSFWMTNFSIWVSVASLQLWRLISFLNLKLQFIQCSKYVNEEGEKRLV